MAKKKNDIKPYMLVPGDVNDVEHIILLHPERTGYSVSVPTLPGCHSQGGTLREALHNIAEAIALHLEDIEAAQ